MSADTPLFVSDAARQLNRSADTIRHWIRIGRLKADRTPGGTRIIRAGDLASAATAERGDDAA